MLTAKYPWLDLLRPPRAARQVKGRSRSSHSADNSGRRILCFLRGTPSPLRFAHPLEDHRANCLWVHALVLITLSTTSACVKPLATPPLASHGGTPVEVPYPPPAARVDIVKEPPDNLKDAVWIDGQWIFGGRRWAWNDGDWKSLPKGFGYAPPKVVRRSDGTLVWFEGTFRRLTDGDTDSP